ncbi:MAG: zinc ribbon domain-containing protein [Clostridiaceae bacterium]|nr:zinc ribbon domain-containing protein [Clostridiaceae bacterium]
MMFCPHCGYEMQEQQNFCKNCGAALTQTSPAALPAGFSPRINDPSFDRYKKKSRQWSFLFALILAVAAIAGFPIYGHYSGEVDWPASLYYGMGIGGMFLVIALLQTLRRGMDKTWDGVVADKKTYRVVEHHDDEHTPSYRQQYVLKIRKDSGRIKKHKWYDQPALYEYYAIGDRIRHHKGLLYYEKFDKSQDKQILCAACLSFIDAQQDQCPRCKCPILK